MNCKLISIQFDDDKREFHRFEGNFRNVFIGLAMKDENGYFIKINGKKHHYDSSVISSRMKTERKVKIGTPNTRYMTQS